MSVSKICMLYRPYQLFFSSLKLSTWTPAIQATVYLLIFRHKNFKVAWYNMAELFLLFDWFLLKTNRRTGA